VNNVRQFYSKRAKGGKTNLTDERVKALEEVSCMFCLEASRVDVVDGSNMNTMLYVTT